MKRNVKKTAKSKQKKRKTQRRLNEIKPSGLSLKVSKLKRLMGENDYVEEGNPRKIFVSIIKSKSPGSPGNFDRKKNMKHPCLFASTKVRLENLKISAGPSGHPHRSASKNVCISAGPSGCPHRSASKNLRISAGLSGVNLNIKNLSKKR